MSGVGRGFGAGGEVVWVRQWLPTEGDLSLSTVAFGSVGGGAVPFCIRLLLLLLLLFLLLLIFLQLLFLLSSGRGRCLRAALRPALSLAGTMMCLLVVVGGDEGVVVGGVGGCIRRLYSAAVMTLLSSLAVAVVAIVINLFRRVARRGSRC